MMSFQQKKTKRNPRKTLENKLDKLCSEYIKLRDKHQCQYGGAKCDGNQMQWSHVIPRTAGKRLRWNPQNSKCLCAYHHKLWWHSNVIEATNWFRGKFPDRYQFIMQEKYKGSKSFSISELEGMVTWFKKEIKKLKTA